MVPYRYSSGRLGLKVALIRINISIPGQVLEPEKGLQPMLGQGEISESKTLLYSSRDNEVTTVKGDHAMQELAGFRRQYGEACEGDAFICSLSKEDFT